MIEVKAIKTQATWPIRHSVMWPDQPIDFVKLEDDETAQHLGLFENDQLCSVISIFVTNDSAQFRKFATLENHQNKGFGTVLLNHVIEITQKQGIKLLWCDARLATLPFYQKFGFEIIGQPFLKYDSIYSKIEKRLPKLNQES
jgi:GNAT superfamily N-acetyltransferase